MKRVVAVPSDVPAFGPLPQVPEGLTDAQARERQARYGLNRLRDERPGRLRLILSRFANPLVLLLLGASAVSALTGDVRSVTVIFVVVLFSVLIDVVQERRSQKAVDALRKLVETRASVLRNGTLRDVPMSDVVPGDVIQLSAGDVVPADARLLTANDLFVNEATLTGESYPVEKRPAASPGEQETGHQVWAGSSIISGAARVVVYQTGASTFLGQTSQALQAPAPPTEAEAGAARFGALILRVTGVLVLFVLAVNAWRGRPFFDSLLFSVALAVGLTPELLPMIVSVTQARGALRLARRRVIVKRPSALQNLGGMDVFCTDKTGSLTEAKIRLERHVDPRGAPSEEVLKLAYLNSHFETGLKSALDDAILAHDTLDVSTWQKVDEVPFDFERRRVSVLVDDGARRLLVVKGAPEELLRLSTHADSQGAPEFLEAEGRARCQQVLDALATEGFRALGIALKEVERTRLHATISDEEGLTFAGACAFLDPPEQSAKSALQALQGDGITVKVLTGDNELVTRHVCAELELPIAGVLLGHEVERLDDASLGARAEQTTLFCRLNPAQKQRVIVALKHRGHVVGYLGDGINDAPSLHAADVGISVDQAVDVARAAADLILLDQDLHVLREGVQEGRRTTANVLKYVYMASSSAFGNMLSMAVASAVLPFLPMLPVQVLLNNLLYDVSEVSLPLDEVDAEDLTRPLRWDTRRVRRVMMSLGPVSSLFDLATFWLLLRLFPGSPEAFHTGWFVESMATQVLVVFIIRTRHNPLRSRPHPALIATSLSIVALALALPYLPFAASLGFVPLPLSFLPVLAGLVLGYLGLTQLVRARVT